jgi:hypothetical protein
MNTPNPCGKCAHLYCDPLVTDDEIERSNCLVGQECVKNLLIPEEDRPDNYCPEFRHWEGK